MAARRHDREPPAPARRRSAQWRSCLAGREPAERLPQRERDELVRYLRCDQRWSYVDIATHTRMTTYTVARIAERIGATQRGHGKGW